MRIHTICFHIRTLYKKFCCVLFVLVAVGLLEYSNMMREGFSAGRQKHVLFDGIIAVLLISVLCMNDICVVLLYVLFDGICAFLQMFLSLILVQFHIFGWHGTISPAAAGKGGYILPGGEKKI